LNSFQRQQIDIAAMQLVLKDLAKCLSPDMRADWLSALHSRIAKIEKDAGNGDIRQTPELRAMAAALERLHLTLSRD